MNKETLKLIVDFDKETSEEAIKLKELYLSDAICTFDFVSKIIDYNESKEIS